MAEREKGNGDGNKIYISQACPNDQLPPTMYPLLVSITIQIFVTAIKIHQWISLLIRSEPQWI
jgi:hypothetical protein